MNFTDEQIAMFSNPGILNRLRSLPRDKQANIAREVAQFRRAEAGERARPDEYSPHANTPTLANKTGLPTPYGARDTHRPDVAADPSAMNFLRDANGQIEKEQLTERLQKQMGTDADRPLPPVTLRDQIAAAADLHGLE